jgi:hypothetical protein
VHADVAETVELGAGPISPLTSSSLWTSWFLPDGLPVGSPGMVNEKCRLPGIGIPDS